MGTTVAIQMDPIGIFKKPDDTYILTQEAAKRGFDVVYFTPQDMIQQGGDVWAMATPLEAVKWNSKKGGNTFRETGDKKKINLADDVDVILMRNEPPFDMVYMTATYMLELLAGKTLVTNDPVSVRNGPEKLLPMHFPQIMPATLVTADYDAIKQFRKDHGDIMLKPLYSYASKGVVHIGANDRNFGSLVEYYLEVHAEPLVVQEYLKKVREGEKRIIMIEGEPVGAYRRIPPENETRTMDNFGGRQEPTPLSPDDRHVCNTIGSFLRDNGLLYASIDVIDGLLTEINVTSPGGMVDANRNNDTRLEEEFWDAVIDRMNRADQAKCA